MTSATKTTHALPVALAVLGGMTVVPAAADVITQFNDRTTFENAVGVPLTVEDFTPQHHFPISSGVLNSETEDNGATNGGIHPGDIQPGVTYSSPIGSGNFFNIDQGGGYPDGGFLDGFNPSDRDVTITFHQDDPNAPRAVSAFGFDMGSLGMTDTDVRISFSSGPDQVFNVVYPAQLEFFGFQSDAVDITSVVISNNGGSFGFDFDNFAFDTISDGCPADLDGDGDADADDFFGYLDAFAAGNLGVCDIDGDGDCDADDFFGYLDLFAQGC